MTSCALHARLPGVVITEEGVSRGQCDDCIGQRVCAVERELHGSTTLIRVTVLDGCYACDGSTTVV